MYQGLSSFVELSGFKSVYTQSCFCAEPVCLRTTCKILFVLKESVCIYLHQCEIKYKNQYTKENSV